MSSFHSKKVRANCIITALTIITIEDFKKLEIKVGAVLSVEKIEGSEKLLKLEIDLGGEKRQIIAGIGNNYEPTNLVGKQVVMLANLEPRQMMGLESQGMILAADSADGPVLLCPDKIVVPGALVK